MARPRIKATRRSTHQKKQPEALDLDQLELMAASGLSVEKMAQIVGVNADTLHARAEFSEAIKTGRARADYQLHSAQLRGALRGNTALLIWLGKQRLGQFEPKQQVEVGGNLFVRLRASLGRLTDAELDRIIERLSALEGLPDADRNRILSALKAGEG